MSDHERRGGSVPGDHNQPLTSQLFLLVQFLNQKKRELLGAEPPHTSHQPPLKGITWIHTFLHGSPHLCMIHQYIYFQQFLSMRSTYHCNNSACLWACELWWLWREMWQSKGCEEAWITLTHSHLSLTLGGHNQVPFPFVFSRFSSSTTLEREAYPYKNGCFFTHCENAPPPWFYTSVSWFRLTGWLLHLWWSEFGFVVSFHSLPPSTMCKSNSLFLLG